METSKDYRILIAEEALSRLEKNIKEWTMPYPINKSNSIMILKEIKANLMKIKYSYLSSKDLLKSEELSLIQEKSLSLKKELLKQINQPITIKQRLKYAEIRYSLWILYGLKYRFSRGEENNPLYSIDVIGVKIKSIEPHPELKKLKITRASTQQMSFTIITNIDKIKKNEVRGAALLPPMEFGGVISEAMYATDLLEETDIGKFISTEKIHRELASKIIELVNYRK